MHKHLHPYVRFCGKLRKQHLLRQYPQDARYDYDFSSNDYLGFSQHPVLIQAAIEATHQGVGSQASRIISPNQHALKTLEADIARSKNTQKAIIFATGFQANISVLSALLDPKVLGTMPLVFADKLNHASMHAACQLAHIKQIRFRHLDYEHLAWLLHKTRDQQQPRYILTESVFGMDGDIADLEKLIMLAKQYKAMLYVDEAHATGLFGSQGYGLSSDFGKEIDVVMGTFSKALGGSGAYVVCSRTLQRYFINRCTGLIYSTAPSPMQVAAMQSAWTLVPSYQDKVKALFHTANTLRQKLQALGFNTGDSVSHIIPIILEDAQKTLATQRFLASKGIRVSAIRPPSVPLQQSRLRIALCTTHTDAACEALISQLACLS
jgi:8-amino-7-oxononanoate synthase